MNIKNISRIFIRTLKSIPERTEWAEKEMKRVGIDNYELYYNLEKEDEILDKWKDEGKIKLGPECFQCGKLKCHCRAKILTRGMTANFISCYYLWKEIAESQDPDDSLYMIMEDDIYFQDNAAEAMQAIFSDNFKSSLPKQPILFKLGWGDMLNYRETHFEVPAGKHIWKQNSDKFANPCYAGNKLFFKFLVDNFTRIESACDMWVHRKMAPLVSNFEIRPALCKELSHVGTIKSAMHKKYSQPNNYLKLFSSSGGDTKYIDKFIESEKEYFDYWFNYWEHEWGIKRYE